MANGYPHIKTFRNGAITHVETEYDGVFVVSFESGEWVVRHTNIGDGPSEVQFRSSDKEAAIYWVGS